MQKNLHSLIENEMNNYENHIDYAAGVQGARSAGVDAKLGAVQNNPIYTSQFDLSARAYAYSLNFYGASTDGDVAYAVYGGYENQIGVPAILKDQPFPLFLFGNSDFAAGFKNAKAFMPVGLYEYGTPFIVKSTQEIQGIRLENPALTGGFYDTSYNSPSVSERKAKIGDLVVPLYYRQDFDLGYTTYTVVEVVLSCAQVGYGTLLESISSDRFVINMIRYNLPDVEKVAQFSEQIKIIKQTLFGKISSDDISPASFRTPQQYRDGIVDIPLEKGIDKESVLCTYILPFPISTPGQPAVPMAGIDLSIFVPTQNKLVQKI